ncbi:Nitrogen metabolite repression protein nmr [Lachnellula suecica]|uniref:Nitrogen metabolite repression protein nmr n=1 Tax=Lachnellula suecica TaxID=602035 RepID=A0A8T9CHG9_9HELO|nr:Nitrogen metabolite repression protein nmr [Lachnellula suecica]
MAGRRLLITGATGKQGGALIEALRARSAPFGILALTRNASSSGAKALAAKPNVTVVEGNIKTPATIFESYKPIYGVFCVTALTPGKENDEEAQAIPLIDAAIKNGVEHFVFTSVERGGDDASEKNPTNIPHFASKHRIEKYMKEQIAAKGSKMEWTILRPVAFMDNLTPNFMGKGFASMWAGVGDKPLQLISCRDIGVFGARAFIDPEAYKGRAISLAGDALTLQQGKEVFKDAVGYPMPETFGFVGSGIKFMSKEMGTMFQWFKDVGYGVDIPALRKEEPQLQDFGTWLKQSSGFRKE